MNVSLFVPALTTFGENVWPRPAPGSQRSRDHFLGVAQSIDGSRVDPVNAKLERAMNCSDGRLVILVTPTMLPTRSTDSPGAEAERRNVNIRVSQSFSFHVRDRIAFLVIV